MEAFRASVRKLNRHREGFGGTGAAIANGGLHALVLEHRQARAPKRENTNEGGNRRSLPP